MEVFPLKCADNLMGWKQYKYRFVPWIAYNWRTRRMKGVHSFLNSLLSKSVRKISKLEDYDIDQKTETIKKLQLLFNNFYDAKIERISADAVLENEFGFTIKRKESSIESAGHGIFVTSGCIKKGYIAAMYPGTIYYPSDPILIQSINNPFILRCIDGLMIDGNDKGISRYIYRSCCGRDIIGPYKPCDNSWLSATKRNPLAVGQYVNNQTTSLPANVVYQEIDVHQSFPLHLREYLPNIYFRNKFLEEEVDFESNFLRVVVLVAIREIQKGEELLSAYFTEVH